MPRVSVLVTTYNNPMVNEALASIEAQTYTDYELILLDDNGPGTLFPLKPEWRYYKSNVRDEDRWKTARYAVQVNQGLKLATGEFIAYLADDDLWLPDKLERIVAFFDWWPDFNVVVGYQEMRQLPGAKTGRTGVRDYRGLTVETKDYEVIMRDPAFVVDHSSVVHRWPISGGSAGWPTREDLRCADALFWRKLYQAGNLFYVLPRVLDVHRYHEKSWSERMDRGEHGA